MSKFKHLPKYFLAISFLPTDPKSNDVILKDVKTVKDFENRPNISETGWDRLKQMFTINEIEGISNELNSIHQAGLFGFLTGAVYGGVITSRKAYLDFMESNMATAFKSHLDAKRKLQDQVTVSFAKGAFKWGWRLGLFTTTYAGLVTCISVYREKSSIFEYLIGGGVTGALYKVSLGLRGTIAGGIIGMAFGGIAGGVSLLLLKATGTSMEEVRYWQYKWKLARNDAIRESMKSGSDPDPALLLQHDEKVGKSLSLDVVQD